MKKKVISLMIYAIVALVFCGIRNYFEEKSFENKIRESLYGAVQEYKDNYLDEYGRYDWQKLLERIKNENE